ncbi:MAG: hypothetical protein KME23_19085 [Goleter apudmare HA4340-LM2]|jgi:hypothetical protein|nr:hypothetical protein [Goleter apudmare HA4340-LM2]
MGKGFGNSKKEQFQQNRNTEFYFFLKEASQASYKNIRRPELVYPFLKANLNKLNYKFIKYFQQWLPNTLSKVDRKHFI